VTQAVCGRGGTFPHARPFTDLQAHDLEIRILDEIALIQDRVTFASRGGTSGRARHTDTSKRRDGWLCIAADTIACEQ
jgi:hypothetical protein